MASFYATISMTVPGDKVDQVGELCATSVPLFKEDADNLRLEIVQQKPPNEDGTVLFVIFEEFASAAARDKWVQNPKHAEDMKTIQANGLLAAPPVIMMGERVMAAGSKV